MLSGIASYLFGTNNADDYNQTKTEEPQCRLRTRYGEDTDEWLIVDPSSSTYIHGSGSFINIIIKLGFISRKKENLGKYHNFL